MWITEILDSRHPEDVRFEMASAVVRLLGDYFSSQPTAPHFHQSKPMESAWVPPLLDFLLLCEKCDTEVSPPHPASAALHILSVTRGPVYFVTTALPALVSMLVPTHPLQLRSLALKAFYGLASVWFSPQMANTLSRDLDKLLRAVGDPLQHPGSWEPATTADDRPMRVAVLLMEFASSDLWRNHLRRSNFASCEEIASAGGGRRVVLIHALLTAIHRWKELLHTPAKIIAAVRRFEELQCLNMAEVVITWAWTVGIINPEDRIAWELIQDETLRFYQSHGLRRLAALAYHIVDRNEELVRCLQWCLNRKIHDKNSTYRAGSAQRPAMDEWYSHICVTQACQLKRLYNLFEGPVTWRNMVTVVVEEVDEETEAVSSRYSVASDPATDRGYSYP